MTNCCCNKCGRSFIYCKGKTGNSRFARSRRFADDLPQFFWDIGRGVWSMWTSRPEQAKGGGNLNFATIDEATKSKKEKGVQCGFKFVAKSDAVIQVSGMVNISFAKQGATSTLFNKEYDFKNARDPKLWEDIEKNIWPILEKAVLEDLTKELRHVGKQQKYSFEPSK